MTVMLESPLELAVSAEVHVVLFGACHGLLVITFFRKRLASEDGQSLLELLIALTVLAIGIGSTLTIFASSLISMQHAGKEGTAISLAERQMETYSRCRTRVSPRRS